MLFRIPIIRGIIDRRILVNFRIDPAPVRRLLPPPFRPKLVSGLAIAGICLIRLKSIRPKLFPLPFGIKSENAAHRIAVEWDENGEVREGVYIPRRDTDSRLNAWAGGRLFPGVHHLATFSVRESDNYYAVQLLSDDSAVSVGVAGHVTETLPATSVFQSLSEASNFFQRGSLGYSVTPDAGRFDGLELRCHHWKIEPFAVDSVQSSFFQDESVFPSGSAQFDCALLMRGLEHEWHGKGDLCWPSN